VVLVLFSSELSNYLSRNHTRSYPELGDRKGDVEGVHLAIVECGRSLISVENLGQDSHTVSFDTSTYLETCHHPSCPTIGSTRKHRRRKLKEG